MPDLLLELFSEEIPARPSARSAAFGFDVPAGVCAQNDVEGEALGEQLIEGRLQALSCRCFQPLPKTQDVRLMPRKSCDSTQRVGHDADGLPLFPENQDLRLSANDGIGCCEIAAQLQALCFGVTRFPAGGAGDMPDNQTGDEARTGHDGNQRHVP